MITILMDQNAIEEALTNYTETDLGMDLSGKEVSIKLIAGRGGNGLRAEVSVTSYESEALEDPENDAVESPLPAAEESEAEEPAIGPFD